MSEIKLVAFDLDGTTVDMAGTVPSQRFCNCVVEGSRRGVVFAPFTGRTITTVPEQIMALPEIRYVSYSNGAGIFDTVTSSYLYRELMDNETCVELLRYLKPYDLPVVIFSDGRLVIEHKILDNLDQNPLLPHHMKSVRNGTAVIVDCLDRYLLESRPNIDKINIVRVLGEAREKIFSDLAKNDKIYAVSSGGVNLEINDKKTNKGNALRFLAEYLGIDIANTMSIGDNDNDVEMLKAAGLGVAVANASDAAKASADIMTDAQNKDGAALAVERFVLDNCTVTL